MELVIQEIGKEGVARLGETGAIQAIRQRAGNGFTILLPGSLVTTTSGEVVSAEEQFGLRASEIAVQIDDGNTGSKHVMKTIARECKLVRKLAREEQARKRGSLR